MQCRSKNITCAFLVTAHIVHKAVVVSLRKIFWWNGFIIFITDKSSTKLHVTHFLDLSLQAFHLNLAQWIKVTLTQGLAFTNGVKFYTFLVLFFPCKIPMPIYFYGISIFPYCLLYNSCEFCLENLYSINNYPPTDLSRYSCHLPAWYCFYFV